MEQVGADIVQLRKDGEALKKILLEMYGSEDKFSEQDRNLLDQIEVAILNKIAEKLENL